MKITDMFTDITPLTIENAEVRILLAEALECDVSEVDDEYLADDFYAFDAPASDTCTLDDFQIDVTAGELELPVSVRATSERYLRLVPEPVCDDVSWTPTGEQ